MVFRPYNDKDSTGLGLVKYLEGNKEREKGRIIHMHSILSVNLNE